MKNLLTSALLGAVAAVVVGGAASAAIATATYRGTISNGFDESGVFGMAGRDLGGLDFQVAFSTNTLANATVYEDSSTSSIYGGAADATEDPTSAVLTIDGQSVAFGLGYAGQVYEYDSGNFEQVAHNASPDYSVTCDQNQCLQSYRNVYASIYGFGADFLSGGANFRRSSGHYDLGQGSVAYGGFSDVLNAEFTPAAGGSHNNYANFTITSVTFGGGVPEPATWALMIGGFGLAGVAMRRRRSLTAA